MRRLLAILALGPLVVALAACGGSGSSGSTHVLHVASKAKVGSVLVDAQGRTLYRYTPDHRGKSTCMGGCAAAWPPAIVSASAALDATGVKGSVATTMRADGARQLTFDGMPLYRFSEDRASSDAKGQGALHIWFVIPAKGATNGATTTMSRGGYG